MPFMVKIITGNIPCIAAKLMVAEGVSPKMSRMTGYKVILGME